VQAALRPPGGTWERAQTVAVARHGAHGVQVALDASGAATVLWARSISHAFRFEISRRPPGGRWSAPETVPARSRAGACAGVSDPRLAVGAHGDTAVLWTATEVVQGVTRRRGGSWSSPVDLSRPRAFNTQVAVDPDGRVVAAWQRLDPRNPVVEAAVRSLAPAPPGSGVPQTPYPVVSDVRVEHASSAAGGAFVRLRLSRRARVTMGLGSPSLAPFGIHMPATMGRRGENRVRLRRLGGGGIPAGRYRLGVLATAGTKTSCPVSTAVRIRG
jgi:hypothetical protein